MTRPRVYKTEAIVLKHSDFGEADSIITLYTWNLGKMRALAKGVRRIKSKLGGHLDLLNRSSLVLAQGQNLDIITQSQVIQSFLPIKTDLRRTSCALYMAELVNQFQPEQVENYAIYELLNSDLSWLCSSNNLELVLRHFELQLLTYLGYQPELYECLICKTSLTPGQNHFSAISGGTLCPGCAVYEATVSSISVDALKVMRYLIKSDSLSCRKLRIDRSLSIEIQQLMRWYIRHLLERDIKSLEFLDRLRDAPDICMSA